MWTCPTAVAAAAALRVTASTLRVVVGKQCQCLQEVAERLFGAAHRHCGVAGTHAGAEGLVATPGRQRMTGQVCPGAERGVGGQLGGVPLVGAHPLAREQVVVDGLGQQRVPEGVAAGLGRHEDVVLDGVADGDVEVARRQVADAGQQAVGDLPPRSRCHPHDVLGGGLELVDSDQEEPGEVACGARTPQRARRGELLCEEGVALGALDDGLDLRLAQRAVDEALNQLADVAVGQRGEVDPVHRGQPRPVREGCPQRVPAVQVVAAVGRHQGHRAAEPPREQQREQVA